MSDTETLIVGNQIREVIKSLDSKTSGDLIDTLNKHLHALVKNATKRTEANGRKTVRGYDFLASESPKEGVQMLLVKSKVIAAIKSTGYKTSSDVMDSFNGYVHWVIREAVARAKANGRSTVRHHDLSV